jgi:hypothetical protein
VSGLSPSPLPSRLSAAGRALLAAVDLRCEGGDTTQTSGVPERAHVGRAGLLQRAQELAT